jgi:hypothetical protein
MFARSSRYRNLAEVHAPDRNGQLVVALELRFIPATGGRFLHTVADQDRLDLLAFKYYADPTKWWQICDANPQIPFPLDLFDRGLVVEERLALVDAANASQFGSLLADVNGVAQVQLQSNAPIAAGLVAIYNAATVRKQIVDAIQARGFRLLSSSSWTVAQGTAESFTLEDPAAKARWAAMLAELRVMPGIAALVPDLTGSAIRIIYNSAILTRSGILQAIGRNGLAVSPDLSTRSSRVGAQILIPPNGAG